MRKILTIMLAATALAGLAAQPAAADDPQATVYNTEGRWGWSHQQNCYTPYREGVVGQYGAWGAYHDGCTVKLRCNYVGGCKVYVGYGSISRYEYYGDPYLTYYQQSCNVRLRVFDRYGALKTYRDGSRSTMGVYTCEAAADATRADGGGMKILEGELVTVQANGVRSTQPGYASVRAEVKLWENRMG